MNMVIYIIDYFIWHYTGAIKDLFLVWSDFLWFVFNYFSIPLLLRTFFKPWKRLGEERKSTFDPVFIFIDIIMRIFGAIVRFFTIVIGLFVCALVVLAFFPVLIVWIALPFIIVLLFISGINLLFK